MAAELAVAKERSSLLQDEINDAEMKLEDTYKRRDQEEAKYEGERDKNEITIRALRKEIGRANEELEQAAVIDEAEAAVYLELLRDARPSPPRHAPQSTPSRDDPNKTQPTFTVASTYESFIDPSFGFPKPPAAVPLRSPAEGTSISPQLSRDNKVLSGLSDRPFGPNPELNLQMPLTGTAQDRTDQRLRRIDTQINREPIVAPTIPPPKAPVVETFQPTLLSNSLGLENSPPRRPKTAAEQEADELLRQENVEIDRQRRTGEALASNGPERKSFLGGIFSHKRKTSWV
ncbi:hypothetical protein P7C70_g514, partial [Phenoliferia sp. Uapishka_3]